MTAAAATHQSAITEATKRRTGTATLPELLPQKRHHLQVVRQPQRPGHNGRPVSSNEVYLFTSLYSSRRFNNEIYLSNEETRILLINNLFQLSSFSLIDQINVRNIQNKER